MASIEVIIRDEQGKVISRVAPQALNLGQQSLHEIEGAVEQWRQRALPEIEADLLEQAQAHFTRNEKRGEG